MAGDRVGAALRGARQLCPAAGEDGDPEAPPKRRRAAAPRVPRGGAAGAPSEPSATAGGDAADPLPSPHAAPGSAVSSFARCSQVPPPGRRRRRGLPAGSGEMGPLRESKVRGPGVRAR